MTATSAALSTALAYHRAWTGGDFDRAMAHIAEDVVCETPSGRIEGADGFRAFMEPFARMLIGSALLAEFGDEETALIMYDTKTPPVASAPAAERLTVRDGVITHLRIIFDRAPFAAAERAAGAS
jgi:ketosteroid isomerase-like protein